MFLLFCYHSNTSQAFIFSYVIKKINNQPQTAVVVGLFSLFLEIMIVYELKISKIITLLKRLEQNYTHVLLIKNLKTLV